MGYRSSVPDVGSFEIGPGHVSTAGESIQTGSAKRQPSLDRVLRLAASGNYEHAYGLLKHESSRDPVLVNARGVVLLRLGRFGEAADLFRNLVLAPGCMWMRKELPINFKLNFATALLLAGHPSGCLDVLAESSDDKNTTVIALRAAIKRWADQLPFWQKLNWRIGKIEPAECRPTIDFVPGDFGSHVGLSAPPTQPATATSQQTAI